MTELRECTTDGEWDRAVELLRQLWSHREAAAVRAWREDEDYRLLGRFVATGDDPANGAASTGGAVRDADRGSDGDERLVAVAGAYVQTVLHHERGCWVHDLVVDEAHRGEGHGAALVADLEDWARERDCAHLALACVPDNDDALAFYDAVGLERFGYVLETEL